MIYISVLDSYLYIFMQYMFDIFLAVVHGEHIFTGK